MSDDQKSDEQKFRETLKRMLKTPPKPHKDKDEERPMRAPKSGETKKS